MNRTVLLEARMVAQGKLYRGFTEDGEVVILGGRGYGSVVVSDERNDLTFMTLRDIQEHDAHILAHTIKMYNKKCTYRYI